MALVATLDNIIIYLHPAHILLYFELNSAYNMLKKRCFNKMGVS